MSQSPTASNATSTARLLGPRNNPQFAEPLSHGKLGLSRGIPHPRHPGQDSFVTQEQTDSQARYAEVPSAAYGHASNTYPVKGIRVECVVGVLPI